MTTWEAVSPDRSIVTNIGRRAERRRAEMRRWGAGGWGWGGGSCGAVDVAALVSSVCGWFETSELIGRRKTRWDWDLIGTVEAFGFVLVRPPCTIRTGPVPI